MSHTLDDGATAPNAVPRIGFRGALLRRIAARLSHGSLTVVTPAGATWRHRAPNPGPDATIVLHRWRAVRRLAFGGDVAFAEAFGDGDWSSPDPATVVALACVNGATIDPLVVGSRLARLWNRLRHRLRANTRAGSRRNIIAHYDLGNEFFAAWLDPGMTYSSALYRRPGATLEEAQTAKQDRAIELLDLRGGERVLEIGIGWGGLADRLLTTSDATLTGITLSPRQLSHATARLSAAGLAPRADLALQDYRDVTGSFDRIISIEMFEAVGEAYWPAFFQAVRDRLVPGGLAVLQVITIAEERFEAYRHGADFIQTHIFPGGMLPSPSVLRAHLAAAGLVLEQEECFGESYARTLGEWHARFQAVQPQIGAMGLDDRFQRLWRYYLAYCEGGFRTGAIDVGLYRIRKPA
ncbi:class I SAM-dependent methyltransferase [Roseomonas stagni]|uniref:Class I SAM-dependent methyltransferase n=1 Tax=Falsiroseomonas algicola TaxID=2716930 RepID=A0A6M1LSV9_9PROT|nr:cyclopropane-fatty-acyl-phospholipid synthase family protein [Falsiroseomonas algicola]NGM22674.1 class I SAM-dependent methyltransferase [Falsiroseomonas algicola]